MRKKQHENQDEVKQLMDQQKSQINQIKNQLNKREEEWKLERGELEMGKKTIQIQLEEESSKYRDAMSKVDQYLAELELANQKINRMNLEQSNTSTQATGVEQRLKNQINQLES